MHSDCPTLSFGSVSCLASVIMASMSRQHFGPLDSSNRYHIPSILLMSLTRLLLPSLLLLPAAPRLLSAQQAPPTRRPDSIAAPLDSGRLLGCDKTSKGVVCVRALPKPSIDCSMPTMQADTTRVVPMPRVKSDSLHAQPMPVVAPGCTPDKKK